MLILNMKDAKQMSVIIGVCGYNFCTFVSDGRLVVYHGDRWTVEKDDFQKIVRVNDRLIYGASGMFMKDEHLLDPLLVYRDLSGLTMPLAVKAIISHAEHIMDKTPIPRNYIVGGRDNKGKFCVHEFHINYETYTVEHTVREPKMLSQTQSEFSISVLLPHKVAPQKDVWVNRVNDCVLHNKYHKDVVSAIEGVIRDIADIDDTVGKRTYALTVQ